jgi:hypothetical protein
MTNLQTLASFDMFLTVVAFVLILWLFATILAHLADEALWLVTPTALKVFIKRVQWNVAVAFAQYAVAEYNFCNRISRRWTNPATLGLRANAESDMRKAINISESYLEELSLLLNGIEQ